jgi:oxepin-CoA hydrolase/3-oxo-5,6-dehydrosuberyl-CoA semialdehyde dehydrogenase
MNQSIDINNREELCRLLMMLDPDTIPLWGKMTPQQMVEHLVDQVQWTNGKKIPTCDKSAEEAERGKQRMIYTDALIPKNVFLGDLPENYQYPTIEATINQLMTELHEFDRYFKKPGITCIHGGFGPMDHNEWVIWHNKHFSHHLRQFNLI